MGWIKLHEKTDRSTHAVWQLCWFKDFFKPLFCFYKHFFQRYPLYITQGWLIEYLSEYLYFKMQFVRNYAFHILVMRVEIAQQRVGVSHALSFSV